MTEITFLRQSISRGGGGGGGGRSKVDSLQ